MRLLPVKVLKNKGIVYAKVDDDLYEMVRFANWIIDRKGNVTFRGNKFRGQLNQLVYSCKVKKINPKKDRIGFVDGDRLNCCSSNLLLLSDIKINELHKVRFLNKIKVNKENDCWEWDKIYTGSHGYGCMSISLENSKKIFKAHQLSYRLFIGEIPKGKWILHKCNNRKCVNPNHLYAGTRTDNCRDMALSGIKKGENHHSNKLTNIIVRNIRIFRDSSSLELSKIFKVCRQTIDNIKNYKTWSHVL